MNLYNIIYTGAHQAYDAANGALTSAIAEKGKDCPVAFPDTAYSIPCIYAATGKKMATLGDLEGALEIVKSLIVEKPLLETALNAGLATALAAEIVEAVKYALNPTPYEAPCAGHVVDPIIRSLGVPLVTGDIPGVAVVLGECKDSETLGKIVKDYQSKGLLTFLVGKVIDQAIEADVKMGVDLRVIPLGYDVTSVIHVVSVAIRAALIFGAVPPGDLNQLLEYTAKRVPAFVNAFGPLSELIVACGAGAIALGFPVITDQVVTEVPCNLLTQRDYDKFVATSLEARNIKIKITEISASDKLEQLRRSDKDCFDLSFPTISGYKEHAAMMHYSATKESEYELKQEGMLLVDSGGQYYTGTTDITRTYILGDITEEQKLHYTSVLRGMIRLSKAKFLYGCRGLNLDILARGPLWDLGIDYKCGTGHGIGFVSNVHEGPNGFRWKIVPERNDSCILEEGMVTTNEPGVYIEGSHGIRIENELICQRGPKVGLDQFMEFETITFAPIDLDGVNPEYMDKSEIVWLNNYHKEVFDKISPYLNEDEVEWLKQYTRAI